MSYQTYNNKTGRNKHSHVVALIVQDFKGFGYNFVYQYSIIFGE
jgi:hypothetical protein